MPDAAASASLRFAQLLADGWTAPRTVVERSDLFVNWADFPAVVSLGPGRLAAHWLQYNGPGTYAYQVRMAFSADGGATWSEAFVPHEQATQTEHGFVTLVPDSAGVEAFWLDGREYEGGSEEMSFRHARVLPPGIGGRAPVSSAMSASLDPAVGETVLDARTCDCCQTSVVRVGDDLVAVYRGRSETEIRDIEIVRRVGGRWSEPVAVHDDGWRIDACPVNGPAVVASGRQVVVTWFTAADSARVLVARSTDGGASFDEPIRIDDGHPLGRVAALSLDDGRSALAWVEAARGEDESGTGRAEVRLRVMDAAGRVSPSVPVAHGSAARASGFPVLARADGDILVAWADPDSGRIRLARGAAH